MQTQLCTLHPPATCQHRIDGKLSHTILCGNNPVSDSFKKCPYKKIAEIVLQSLSGSDTKCSTPKSCSYCRHEEQEIINGTNGINPYKKCTCSA